MFDIKTAKAQIASARYNCKVGWPFPDADIVLNGYEQALKRIEKLEESELAKTARKYKELCNLQAKRIKKLEEWIADLQSGLCE